MGENNNNGMNTKDFFIGTLIGGFVGAAAALLFAPKSGKELRHDINEQAKVAKEFTADWTNTAVEKGNQIATSAKEGTTNFARSVSDQSNTLLEKVKDLATSVRKDMAELTESADSLTDDLEGISEEIAASVKKEVEDLQRSVEELVREVEEKEKNKE
ncbi:YtxH domain-containing protein [Evansella tamaricis]|uniref:YtxH domain-containing protein n=1 Tax=Evansella tamaricis TaxID=2069301 RepID=A0ABS6JNB3_9BACI|nr:YtxH domain-containing protein [Evansella tamaricis]MBU9714684.1 YtxH domain-containing protein [Evansella tamaricis]